MSPNQPEAMVFVLHGASGDLARRLVLPSVFDLFNRNLLPKSVAIVGCGLDMDSTEAFATHIRDNLKEFGFSGTPEDVDRFIPLLSFAGPGALDGQSQMAAAVKAATAAAPGAVVIHYLALPPKLFQPYTDGLAAAGVLDGARVVYEKPFGTSLETFEALQSTVEKYLTPSQVFRMDHFMGSEVVQNLRQGRFFNPAISATWNAQYLQEVQVDFPEVLDIDFRAAFYDATGAFMDVLMTHLFQVASEVAMEPPVADTDAAFQQARNEAFAHFRPLDPAECVFAQFEGYRETPGVPADSTTETFAAVRLWIDNDRWRGVPFLLRTGKQMAVTDSRVTLVYREPKELESDGNCDNATLTFSGFSHDGAIGWATPMKQPGPSQDAVVGIMKLPLSDLEDEAHRPLRPYGRLILDIVAGDVTRFTTPEGLRAVWKCVTGVLDAPPALMTYPRHSMGPDGANVLPPSGQWFRR